MLGLDLRDPLVDRLGVVVELLGAELVEGGQGHHPVAVALVGLAVDQDHLVQRRRLRLVVAQLVDLAGVLGEDDLDVGVRDDVRDVRGHRGRVDRGGRGRGEDAGQVALDPFEPGTGGDAHPLLGLDAQGDQPGGAAADKVFGLLPGHGPPTIGGRGPEGLAIWRRGDAVEEHLCEMFLAVAEQRELGTVGNGLHVWPPRGVK